MHQNMCILVFISWFVLFSCQVFTQSVTFTDVAGQMGVTNTYNNPSFGGGVSFFDFDLDGADDLSLASANGENIYLYKNEGNAFAYVSEDLNISNLMHSRAILWADYDNDGDQDLFVVNNNYHNLLFNNHNMKFTDVTESSGISITSNNSSGACFGDFNNDGWLDLYVITYHEAQPNRLYKNNGDGTFTDVTALAGVGDTSKVPLAVVFVDYNNDGWQDIYIANDKMDGNTLFKNDGDGTFSDVSAQSGADFIGNCMGIAVGDYDNDLDLDLYISNSSEGNGLLKNNGDGTFTQIAEQLGIAVHRICWGVNFFDMDNDTDLDLFVAVSKGIDGQDFGYQNVLFENNGDGTFTQTSSTGIDSDSSYSFGTSIGDFNSDGFYDIAVMNSAPYPFELWANSGNSNNWIKIKLNGIESNKNGIGSILEFFVQDKHFIRSTHCGISYLSQNNLPDIYGVGDAETIDSIKIYWSGGTVDILYDVNVNQIITVTEGETLVNIGQLSEIPFEFNIEQNYPNPFNPETRIRFSLAADSDVKIKIFNALGEQVDLLVNKFLPAGEHEVSFNATGLNSGVYFYRMEIRNLDKHLYSPVRKMSFIK